MAPSSVVNWPRLVHIAFAAAAATALSVSTARAQETWAPVIMFDGSSITINGGTSAINPAVPPASHYVFGPPAPGAPDPLISYPNGIAENRITGEWIVADSYHSRLLRFATDHNNSGHDAGAYLGSIDIDSGNSIPYTPVIDDDGVILVPDFSKDSHRIFAFTPSGASYIASEIASFRNGSTPDSFGRAIRIALIPDAVNGMHLAQGIGTVVVLDSSKDRVLKLTPAGGVGADAAWTLQIQFGQNAALFGVGPGKFSNPTGLAVDAAGNIYVTDPQNEQLISIQVFSPAGTPLQTISQGLSAPWSVTLDATGRLFVTDTANNRISVFAKYDAQNPTASLAPIAAHIGTASQPLGGIVAFDVPNAPGPIGMLQEPAAIVIDQQGRLLVADSDDFRIQIFDKARLNVSVLADPQTMKASDLSVTVRVSVSLPIGDTAPLHNVLPAIPAASFAPGASAVVTAPPACVVQPGSSACVPLGSLAGQLLDTNTQPLVFAFQFNRIIDPQTGDAVGPVWFSTSATGLDAGEKPVQSGDAETYAVAVRGDLAQPPTITSDLALNGTPGPASGWYATSPVLVHLKATLPSVPANGTIQEIDFNFGATPPEEGDFYTCFNVFTSNTPADTTCTLPIFKEGITTVWYRALSTTGLYNRLEPSAVDGTINVPAWDSIPVQLDFSPPTFSLQPRDPSNPAVTPTQNNGWYTVLPLEFDFTVTDLGSYIDTVQASAGGGASTVNSTSGAPFASGTFTYSTEGTFPISVAAVDRAGNAGNITGTINIDVVPPALTFSSATSSTGIQTIGGTQWSRTPVTATFAATDAGSGFDAAGTHDATCTATTPPTDGTQTVTCAIPDWAGNSGHATAGPYGIDTTAPSVVGTPPVPTATVQGVPWYNGPVAVSFLANDNGGVGFAGNSQTQQSAVTSNGEIVTATFQDLLGNIGNGSAGPFNVDTAPPAITYAVFNTDSQPIGPGTPAGPGVLVGGVTFFTSPVVVDFTGNDGSGSGFATTNPDNVLVRSHQVNSGPQTLTETYRDVVGNSASLSAGPFSVDAAAPTYTFTTTPAGVLQGATRWYAASPATVTFVGDDGPLGSGFSTGRTKTTIVNVVANTASTTFTDLVGNSTNATAGPFNIDVTPPTYTFTTAPGGVLVGGTRWYTASPATVTFTATDAQSGFASGATSTATVPVVANAASASFSDLIGNTVNATAGPFAVDAAAPTITVTTPTPDAMVGTTPWYRGPTVNVTFLANDDGGAGFTGGAQTQTTPASSNGAVVSATFADVLGNSAGKSAGPFNVDGTGPVVTATTTFLDNTPATGVTIGGVTYFKAAVKVVFTATDAGAGFSTVSPVATSTQTVTVSGGTQLVSATFADVLGNAATQSLGSYAVDATAPVFGPLSNVTVPASVPDGNPTTAIVTYVVTATDNSGATPATSCAPASGSSFAFGTTTVQCTATDAVGNMASSTFTVTVQDRTPPVLSVPAPIVLNVSVPTTVTYTATAVDNLDASPTVSCSPASGTTFPVGTTTVSCTATDHSGNASAPSTFTVKLAGPSTPPVVTVPSNIVKEAAGPTGAMVTYTASASDANGSVPVTCLPASGSTFPIQTTTVSCKATNSAGTTTNTFTVKVADTTPPVITQADITVVATSSTGAIVTFTPTVSDAVDLATDKVVCAPASGSRFAIATTTVACSATDRAGNKGTKSFKVTVTHSLPVCTAAVADPKAIWPPNHNLVNVNISGVTNADGAAITYSITSIFQDEPTSGLGDGDVAIDGFGVGSSQARVRAERDGNGNGRVYHIKYTATTAAGSCSGEVTAGVPHNNGATAVDGGALYDSTIAPPTAINNTASTLKGVPVTINVLANDSDPLGYSLTVTAVGAAAHGTTKLNTNGSITYTPVAGYAGSDAFTYTISNGHGGTASATVTVTISAHSRGDDCDHDDHRNGHHDGDNCDHDKDLHTNHHDDDGCDHDRHRNGHYDGDGCDHDRSRGR